MIIIMISYNDIRLALLEETSQKTTLKNPSLIRVKNIFRFSKLI